MRAVGRRPDVVLIDEGHPPIGMPDSSEPPATLVDPGVQLTDMSRPTIDWHRGVDASDVRLVSLPVNGVLQLQVRGQGNCLDLGPRARQPLTAPSQTPYWPSTSSSGRTVNRPNMLT
jgi:hypothetical protein